MPMPNQPGLSAAAIEILPSHLDLSSFIPRFLCLYIAKVLKAKERKEEEAT